MIVDALDVDALRDIPRGTGSLITTSYVGVSGPASRSGTCRRFSCGYAEFTSDVMTEADVERDTRGDVSQLPELRRVEGSDVCAAGVKTVGRKKRTLRPFLLLVRRGGASRGEAEPVTEATTREPARRNASTADVPLAARVSVMEEASDGEGEKGRTSKEKGTSGTLSSLNGDVGVSEMGEVGDEMDNGTGNERKSSVHRPRWYELGRRTDRRRTAERFFFRSSTGLTMPIMRMKRPIHIIFLPHLPRKPMNAASSACQLLP